MSAAHNPYLPRTLDELKAHAHQIGTGHGTTDGEEYTLDPAGASRILDWLNDPNAYVDFRERRHIALAAATLSVQASGGGIDAYEVPVYRPLGITADHPGATDVRLAYDQGYNDAMRRIIRRRAAQLTHPPSPSAPHGYHKIRVVLIATSNPHIAPRLPLAGELEVFETTVNHFVTPGRAIFREANADGSLCAPAEVRDIAYVYDNRTFQDPVTRLDSTYHSVRRDASLYAAGRRDQADGDPLSQSVELFAGLYVNTWHGMSVGSIPGNPEVLTLRDAYENWLRDGTLFGPDQCVRCGLLLTLESRAAYTGDQAPLRRCQVCSADGAAAGDA